MIPVMLSVADSSSGVSVPSSVELAFMVIASSTIERMDPAAGMSVGTVLMPVTVGLACAAATAFFSAFSRRFTSARIDSSWFCSATRLRRVSKRLFNGEGVGTGGGGRVGMSVESRNRREIVNFVLYLLIIFIFVYDVRPATY